MIAFVFGVIAASIFAGSMHLVLGSQSTNTAVAPAIQIASAVAKNVFGWVMTSSPGPIPSAINASQMASVPLPTPIACAVPWNAASSCSNCFSIGPCTYSPLSITRLILASISAWMFLYCRTCP